MRFHASNRTSSCLVQIKVEPVGVQHLDGRNGINLPYSRLKPVQLLDLLGWLSLHSFSHGKHIFQDCIGLPRAIQQGFQLGSVLEPAVAECTNVNKRPRGNCNFKLH